MQLFAYRNTERSAKKPVLAVVPQMESSRILMAARVDAGRLITNAIKGATTEAELIVMKAQAKAEAIIADALKRATQILGAAGLEKSEELPAVIDLIRSVADKYGVSVADIKGYARNDVIVTIRHEAMALTYRMRPDLSLPQIGRMFNRDHTTVLHAVRKLGLYRGSRIPHAAGD